MTATWQPYREPLSATLIRTVGIALVVGGVIALRYGKPQAWLVIAGLVLWISFGGHWVEIVFLNWLRPRLKPDRALQAVARLVFWFGAGVVLGFCVIFTMRFSLFTASMRTPPWWMGGVVFVAVELIAHFALSMRNRPSFYRGDG